MAQSAKVVERGTPASGAVSVNVGQLKLSRKELDLAIFLRREEANLTTLCLGASSPTVKFDLTSIPRTQVTVTQSEQDSNCPRVEPGRGDILDHN